MTYFPFSIARRFAAAQAFVMLLPLLLITACEPGQLKEGLAPDDSEVAVVEVTPESAAVTVGQVVVVRATAQTNSGQPAPVEVDWSSDGGTLAGVTDSTAQFSAALAGSYWIRGRHRRNRHPEDSTTITVTNPTPVLQAVILAPASAALNTGATRQFSVSGQWSNGATTAPAVIFNATGGTITSGGLYTAGSSAGTFRVVATHQGGTLADTAVITLTAAPPMLQAVILTPSSAALATGATQQFSVSGQWSNGATTAPAVTYSATGGTVSTGGLYTAGATAGTFRIIATQQGGTLADTSSVTLTTTPPVLQAVILTPSSAALATGSTQQFSVSGQWSNGATTAPAVTYSATGGTVTTGGLYAAGSTAGAFRVIATQQGGTLADTSTVTLTATPPVLQAVILTPSSAALATGATQQFSVSGQWSNGTTTAPAVTYSATGGTVTTGGLYTAGGTAGTFRVVATQQGGTLADTSTVTLTATPPVLQAVIMTQSSTSLKTGGTQQFSVSGQWSNGATTVPAVTYSATGGTISTGGMYTAGGTAGSFRVIAVQQGGTLADTSTVNLTAPTSGWLAHKPANFTNVVADYGFNAPIPSASSDQPMGDGSGWHVYYPTGARTTTRVAGTPGEVSSQYAVETLYQAGDNSGVGKVKFYHDRISASVTEFYVALRVKWDSNYEWQSISNKLFYIEPGNIVLQSRHNSGGIQRYLSVYIGSGDTDHMPTNNVAIPLGEWVTIEYQVKRHATQGELHVWLNGVETMHRTGIFVPTTSSTQELDINDTWGGAGSPRTRDSRRWLDHVYIATP